MSKDLTLEQVTKAAEVIDQIGQELKARGYRLEYKNLRGQNAKEFHIIGERGYFNLVGVWEWLNGKGPVSGASE